MTYVFSFFVKHKIIWYLCACCYWTKLQIISVRKRSSKVEEALAIQSDSYGHRDVVQ